MNKSFAPLAAFALLLPAVSGSAQSNTVAGRDVSLFSLSALLSLGRTGTFPNGINGFAETTTSCNVGVGNLPWSQAMNPNHPFISFLLTRQLNGRLEQISDRSFVKHGFFATNSGGCGSCQNPGTGSLLGVGCSDTYSTGNNGDNYWLAPADEIDPWLGTWTVNCSQFDKGEPPVAAPFNCDGVRSLTTTMAANLGPVGHRIRVLDSDLNLPGAVYAFQGMYTSLGEAEDKRGNNLCWRPFTAAWSAGQNKWNVTVQGTQTYGSILDSWVGATVNSSTNGVDDGRVYVGLKVSGPTNGMYHYEYAVHNRDNQRGVKAFRLPVCASAQILNAGFRDVDQDSGNQWAFSSSPTEISWTTAGNPLNWNTIYNFWFDSDAAPRIDTVLLDQDKAGGGAAQIAVATNAPTSVFNEYLGLGCSSDATPPVLYATGSPDHATLPNPSLALVVSGAAAGSPVTLLWSPTDAALNLGGGCIVYLGGTLGMDLLVWSSAIANGSGVATFPVPTTADPSLEGVSANFQAVLFNVAGGPLFDLFELSNGLRVRAGNSIPACEP